MSRRTCTDPLAFKVVPTSRLPRGSKVGCAAVSRGGEKGQRFQRPRRPKAAGPADEVDPRDQETFGGGVGGQEPHGPGVLVAGQHGVQPGDVLHFGEQPVVLGVRRGRRPAG